MGRVLGRSSGLSEAGNACVSQVSMMGVPPLGERAAGVIRRGRGRRQSDASRNATGFVGRGVGWVRFNTVEVGSAPRRQARGGVASVIASDAPPWRFGRSPLRDRGLWGPQSLAEVLGVVGSRLRRRPHRGPVSLALLRATDPTRRVEPDLPGENERRLRSPAARAIACNRTDRYAPRQRSCRTRVRLAFLSS